MIYAGYFNPKTKGEHVSAEDTKERMKRSASKFISNLRTEITGNPGDFFISGIGPKGEAAYERRRLPPVPSPSPSAISPAADDYSRQDPIQYLFKFIIIQISSVFPVYDIGLFRESDPDGTPIFKIPADIVKDFHDMYLYLKPDRVCPTSSGRFDIVLSGTGSDSVTAAGSDFVRTEIDYEYIPDCVYDVTWIISDAIEDYINGIDSDCPQTNSSGFWADIRYKKLYDAFQNALYKEFKIHQGKPSLMRVLDLTLTDRGKMISTAEKNFAKLSACISDQIPVRIDLNPVFKIVPTEPDNIFDGINRILLKFFDVFSEEMVQTVNPYRIKM